MSLDYIVFLKLILEPLIYLASRLRALYYIEPVTAGSLGILGSKYLYVITVFNLIVDGNELSVYSRTNHLVTYS